MTLVEKLRGKFVVFDGPDGSGKSTQRERFGETLSAACGDVVHCKDPGGTFFGDEGNDYRGPADDAGYLRQLKYLDKVIGQIVDRLREATWKGSLR